MSEKIIHVVTFGCDILGCKETITTDSSDYATEQGWDRANIKTNSWKKTVDLCPEHARDLAEFIFQGDTHIAVDGSTHTGPAHPCVKCDGMEQRDRVYDDRGTD